MCSDGSTNDTAAFEKAFAVLSNLLVPHTQQGYLLDGFVLPGRVALRGVGAQPPSTSWGLMVNKMKEFLARQPVGTLAPGVVILILVLAFNFLGDGLRDALDPRLRR